MINVEKLIMEAELLATEYFKEIEKIALANQKKVLEAFRKNRVSAMHFHGSTGYGYDDIGRDTLQRVFADIFDTEAAIVSPLITSGTHALTIALFGICRPGDCILSVTGKPYDTLDEVINGKNNGSLKEFNVDFSQIEMSDGKLDYVEIKKEIIKLKPKIVFLQRSRGYSLRDALSLEEIKRVSEIIKKQSPNSIFMVDNCYGEFVCESEPTSVGADLIVGSFIKNPGGGIAPTGGYLAGKKSVIDLVASRFTSPSIGTEVGSFINGYLPFYQGLFLAPTTVSNALKSSILAGYAFQALGYETLPSLSKKPSDIIRSIRFNTKKELIDFVQAIQYVSPVDSYVTPEPWDMPGYTDQVIMAAGTFVQGASIELSADSPIKEPYVGYLQGALTYEHGKLAVTEALKRIVK